jgi:hypothetical protein
MNKVGGILLSHRFECAEGDETPQLYTDADKINYYTHRDVRLVIHLITEDFFISQRYANPWAQIFGYMGVSRMCDRYSSNLDRVMRCCTVYTAAPNPITDVVVLRSLPDGRIARDPYPVIAAFPRSSED